MNPFFGDLLRLNCMISFKNIHKLIVQINVEVHNELAGRSHTSVIKEIRKITNIMCAFHLQKIKCEFILILKADFIIVIKFNFKTIKGNQ